MIDNYVPIITSIFENRVGLITFMAIFTITKRPAHDQAETNLLPSSLTALRLTRNLMTKSRLFFKQIFIDLIRIFIYLYIVMTYETTSLLSNTIHFRLIHCLIVFVLLKYKKIIKKNISVHVIVSFKTSCNRDFCNRQRLPSNIVI